MEGFQFKFHDGQSPKFVGLAGVPAKERVFQVPYSSELCEAKLLFDRLRDLLREKFQSGQWQQRMADLGHWFDASGFYFRENREALSLVFASIGDEEIRVLFLDQDASDKIKNAISADNDIDETYRVVAEDFKRQLIDISEGELREAMEIRGANAPHTVLVLFKIVN